MIYDITRIHSGWANDLVKYYEAVVITPGLETQIVTESYPNLNVLYAPDLQAIATTEGQPFGFHNDCL